MIAGLLVAAALAVCYPPPVDAPVSVPFVQPACTYCPGHRGLEYRLAPGTPVRFIAPGVVTFAGMVAGTEYVVVLQIDGLRATYGQLEAALVARGDVVAVGQAAGRSGPQLYFGLRNAADTPIDPAPLLGVLVGRVRLVPGHGGGERRVSVPRRICAAIVSSVSTV